MDDPDARLLRAHARGDPHAFADLLARYRSRILHLVRCRVGAGSLWAEDIAQDVFVQVHRKAATFQGAPASRPGSTPWPSTSAAIISGTNAARRRPRPPISTASSRSCRCPTRRSIRSSSSNSRSAPHSCARRSRAEPGAPHGAAHARPRRHELRPDRRRPGVPLGTVRSRLHNARAAAGHRARPPGAGHERIDTMNCADAVERLSAALDGELPPADAVEVARHLDACDACARRLRTLQQVRTAVKATAFAPVAGSAFDAGVLERVRLERPATAVRFSPAWLATAAALIVAVSSAIAHAQRPCRAARAGTSGQRASGPRRRGRCAGLERGPGDARCRLRPPRLWSVHRRGRARPSGRRLD